MSSNVREKVTKREVHGVQHQLDAHEHDERDATGEESEGADAEQPAAKTRYHAAGTFTTSSSPPLARRRGPIAAAPREQDGADDGDDEQRRGDLEREEVRREDRRAQLTSRCRCRPGQFRRDRRRAAHPVRRGHQRDQSADGDHDARRRRRPADPRAVRSGCARCGRRRGT